MQYELNLDPDYVGVIVKLYGKTIEKVLEEHVAAEAASIINMDYFVLSGSLSVKDKLAKIKEDKIKEE